ncbi:hypothetical protein ACN28S_24525 [Cystobacter fuscus]
MSRAKRYRAPHVRGRSSAGMPGSVWQRSRWQASKKASAWASSAAGQGSASMDVLRAVRAVAAAWSRTSGGGEAGTMCMPGRQRWMGVVSSGTSSTWGGGTGRSRLADVPGSLTSIAAAAEEVFFSLSLSFFFLGEDVPDASAGRPADTPEALAARSFLLRSASFCLFSRTCT